jgi:hypothetical protein
MKYSVSIETELHKANRAGRPRAATFADWPFVGVQLNRSRTPAEARPCFCACMQTGIALDIIERRVVNSVLTRYELVVVHRIVTRISLADIGTMLDMFATALILVP